MFLDPYPSNRLDYDSPSPLEDAAGGVYCGQPAAANPQSQACDYESSAGTTAFDEPEYRPYEWQSPPIIPVPPHSALLAHEHPPEPQQVPDYHSTLTSEQLVRDAFGQATAEGSLDATPAGPSHVLRVAPGADSIRYADEARHEIDAAIELARRSVEPPISESSREIDAAIDFARQSDVPPFSQSTREIEDAIDHAKRSSEPGFLPDCTDRSF